MTPLHDHACVNTGILQMCLKVQHLHGTVKHKYLGDAMHVVELGVSISPLPRTRNLATAIFVHWSPASRIGSRSTYSVVRSGVSSALIVLSTLIIPCVGVGHLITCQQRTLRVVQSYLAQSIKQIVLSSVYSLSIEARSRSRLY